MAGLNIMFTAQCFSGVTEQMYGNCREVNPKKAREKNN